VEGLQWTGRALFLVGTRDDTAPSSQVFRIHSGTDTISSVTNDAGRYSSLSMTSEGSLVTVQKSRTAGIWVSASSEPTRARRRTSAGSQYYGISWADGGRILSRADVAGVPTLWLVAADRDATEVVTQGPFEQRNARLCGSGPYIVFSSASTGSWKIWRMDLDGRNARQLTMGNSIDGGGVCTPDGKWVIFNSDRSGRTTLWRVSIDGGESQPLTTDVSYYAEVSPDGNLIACTFLDSAAANEGRVAVLPVTGGTPLRRLKNIPASSQLRWGPRPDAITFVRTVQEVSNLFIRDITDGSDRQITRFDTDQIFAFDWSRDFSRLAMVRGVETRNAVILTRTERKP
jgi:hypothetical protein